MKENKDTVVIDDKKLKQTKGGAANWISTMGQVVQCNADCNGEKSNRCNVKNSGCCGYNR